MLEVRITTEKLYLPLDEKTVQDSKRFLEHEQEYRALLASAGAKEGTGIPLTHNESTAVRERAFWERITRQSGRI